MVVNWNVNLNLKGYLYTQSTKLFTVEWDEGILRDFFDSTGLSCLKCI